MRSYFRSILEGEGFRTLEAENAADALRIVHRLGGSLDLIVSDIKMPGDMDGIDLAHSVRMAFPAIPLLLVSGYTDTAVDGQTPNFEFLRKPFRPEAMVEAVRRIAGRRTRPLKA